MVNAIIQQEQKSVSPGTDIARSKMSTQYWSCPFSSISKWQYAVHCGRSSSVHDYGGKLMSTPEQSRWRCAYWDSRTWFVHGLWELRNIIPTGLELILSCPTQNLIISAFSGLQIYRTASKYPRSPHQGIERYIDLNVVGIAFWRSKMAEQPSWKWDGEESDEMKEVWWVKFCGGQSVRLVWRVSSGGVSKENAAETACSGVQMRRSLGW